jgi:hypothetical protein
MSTDEDFIRALRIEIADTQTRRMSYVKAKLGFLIGLLGVGAAAIKEPIPTSPLFYLVPVVAFLFDLYIMGEDFAIKRAGAFICNSPFASREERIWEETVSRHRDWFAFFAAPLSSGIALVVAARGVVIAQIATVPFIPWIVVGMAFVLVVLANRWLQAAQVSAFSKDTAETRARVKSNSTAAGDGGRDRASAGARRA